MIHYTFVFDADNRIEFSVDEHRVTSGEDCIQEVPEWLRLDAFRCDHCSLPPESRKTCPAALSIRQAVSDDHKQNWTLTRWPERPAGDWSLPSPFLAVSPRHPHQLCALESQRHAKGNLPGRILLWTADGRRLDWTCRGVVVEFPEALGMRSDITYPWMTYLDGNAWFLVFYCGQSRGPSAIYGMRLCLADSPRSSLSDPASD